MPESLLVEKNKPTYEELLKKIEVLESEANTGFPNLKNSLSETLPNLIDFLISMIIAIVLFFIGLQIIKLIVKFVNSILERKNTRKTVIYVINTVVKSGLTIILFLSVARIVGVKTASFVALLGSFGIALGLALRGNLSDMASGLLILFLRPIAIGNIVHIDNLDSPRLTVKQIRLFQTVLKDANNFHYIVPNTEIISNTMINLSKNKYVRLETKVSISYDSDIDLARNIMMNIFEKEERINDKRPKDVVVQNLGESGIEMVGR
ncbi:MAG: mechanosensitive ion channel, partial [Andreesenia angusta]|nr:mechanosensitive ion channel [Andreesenia angusta]